MRTRDIVGAATRGFTAGYVTMVVGGLVWASYWDELHFTPQQWAGLAGLVALAGIAHVWSVATKRRMDRERVQVDQLVAGYIDDTRRKALKHIVRLTRADLDDAWQAGDLEIVVAIIAELREHVAQAEREADELGLSNADEMGFGPDVVGQLRDLADENQERLQGVRQ